MKVNLRKKPKFHYWIDTKSFQYVKMKYFYKPLSWSLYFSEHCITASRNPFLRKLFSSPTLTVFKEQNSVSIFILEITSTTRMSKNHHCLCLWRLYSWTNTVLLFLHDYDMSVQFASDNWNSITKYSLSFSFSF